MFRTEGVVESAMVAGVSVKPPHASDPGSDIDSMAPKRQLSSRLAAPLAGRGPLSLGRGGPRLASEAAKQVSPALILCIVFAFALEISPSAVTAAPASDPDPTAFFESRIRPLLVEKCYSCHSAQAKKLKGGLYLDGRDSLVKGGDSGPAIVPGNPDQSRLIDAVRYGNPDLQMPPKTRLTDAQVADLTQWVKAGAAWPAEKKGQTPSGPARPVFDLQKRKAEHWAWQPIRRQTPPAVTNAQWPRGPIDGFILAKLEAAGLSPAPDADRRTLIRRAYFDLTGLPPTPQAAQAFVDDPSPAAFETVVDRLLASPQFGERWARHWLDLVRFAETRGHEFDYPIPNAWRYRDYVVRAFNADVPYDQFITEHLAGDLLDQPRMNPSEGFDESVLGTGFWFLGEEVHSPVDIRQDEADRMNSRLDTMTKAVLGLTVGCARCHDHKFDAISTKDYYALTGVLISSAYRQVPFDSLQQDRHVAAQLQALRDIIRPTLLKLTADAEMPGISRTADSLLAARDVLLGTKRSETGETARLISETAASRKLDERTLAGWVDELKSSRRNARHPLHPFATIALGKGADVPASFDALRQSMFAAAGAEQSAALPAPSQVLVDYTRPGAGWWQDGFTFGTGPARAGEIDLQPAAAGFGVVPFSAARRDPAWPAIQPIESETDIGPVGGLDRPGRTFRTPKVTLNTGKVWFLTRGSGEIYAAVDTHLIIQGPLHGKLVTRFNADDTHWRWIQQDLTEYPGQRVEFEFSPAGNEPLAVAKIVDSEEQPSDPLTDPRNRLVLDACSSASVRSVESLAGSYQALFAGIAEDLAGDKVLGAPDADARAPLADWLVRHPDLFSDGDSPARRNLAAALREAIGRQEELLRQVKSESRTAPAAFDGNGVDENVLVRGVAKNTGDLVPRRFLEAIAGSVQPPYPANSSGRLRLARDILSPDDPFPARVMANRVWQHLMGTGIVPTVDNFGVLGQAPSHPELLDYLAGTFRGEMGWSVKKLIRSIVLSRTYQMSSFPDPHAEQADPQDMLLHRMPVRRLEAEAIRDEVLAVSGRLDQTVGGPSVDVYITDFMQGRGRPAGGPLDGEGRRSLYIKVRRNFLSPMMLAYDMPIPFATVGRRSISNVPAQALILMNDPFVTQQAGVWATRILSAGKNPAERRIAQMYQQAFARPPTDAEVAEGVAFLSQMGELYGLDADHRADDERVWTDYAHVLFNVKEFIFVK
jgi:hypothetical protein